MRLDRCLNQPFVLSGNVEAMKRPQKVVTSTIRFECFDFVALVFGKAIEEIQPTMLTRRERLLGPSNWEVGFVWLWQTEPLPRSKRAGKNVEAATTVR